MPKLKWKEPSEAEIEDAIICWLNWQPGCYAFKMHVKGTWNEKGKFYQRLGKHVPRGGADIIFCAHGKFGCFEVKKPAAYRKFLKNPGEHEFEQKAFLLKVQMKGGLAAVVCSLDQAQEYYRKWGV